MYTVPVTPLYWTLSLPAWKFGGNRILCLAIERAPITKWYSGFDMTRKRMFRNRRVLPAWYQVMITAASGMSLWLLAESPPSLSTGFRGRNSDSGYSRSSTTKVFDTKFPWWFPVSIVHLASFGTWSPSASFLFDNALTFTRYGEPRLDWMEY